jgi:hypothetical protein
LSALLGACIFASAAQGQSAPPPPKPAADGRAGQAHEVLSAAQQAKVKDVLAPYKANSLSVDDAKAIKRALRDAGMRRSPALDDALRSAGFNADKLDALDPPPSRPPREGDELRPAKGDPPATPAPRK